MTPIELGPIPDPEFPEGSQIGSAEGSSTSYERAAGELLHRPHAFALMHGDGGAKVAYGELHWRVDVITLRFETSAIAVADHADHAHEHDHTHSISGSTGSGPTGSGSDTVTTSIDDATTGNVNGGSGTVTTSGASPEQTGTDTGGGGYGSTGHFHQHPHTHTAGVASHTHEHDHTHTIPSHQHSLSLNTGQPNEATTSGVKDTDGSTYGSGSLTHTVSGQITYCSGAAQEEIGNITQQVPNVDTKDGNPMKAVVHGENNEDPYHQLSSYGDVYLVWEVDLEKGKFNEITNCWVQIGEPDPFAISSVGMGTSTTGRRDEAAQDGSTEGTYHVKLGSVSMDNKITQNVTSDVVWSPTVMDRIGP